MLAISIAFAAPASLAAEAGPISTRGRAIDEAVIVAQVQYGRPPTGHRGRDRSGCIWAPYNSLATLEGGLVEDRRVVDGVTYLLFHRACPGPSIGSVWVPQLSARRLGEHARREVRARLPQPTLHAAPDPSAAIVNAPSWLWTDPADFRSVSITAWLPTEQGVRWSTATATPLELVFDSGERGRPPLRCDGPGRAWSADLGDDAASTCAITHRRPGATRATWTIRWRVTIRGNDGAPSSTEEMTTTTVVDIRVREIVAVLDR